MKKTMLTILGLFLISGIAAQTEVDKVIETVNKGDIEGHIYFLSDDLLRGREAGTPGNKIAAAYIANAFRSYGVQPNPQSGDYYQMVPLKKTEAPQPMYLAFDGKEYKYKMPVKSANLSLTTEAVFMGHGLEADYKGKDVRKKFVVVKAGDPDNSGVRSAFRLRSKKEELARSNGAVGVLELLDVDKNMWSRLDHFINAPRLELASEEEKNSNDQFGYVWLMDQGGTMAEEMESKASVTVRAKMLPSNSKMITTQNVVGIVEGTDPELKNEYIVYGAHYDHVGVGRPNSKGDSIYNGARDNAVGTTTVLSMAENLAKYPTKRSALFILFTAEEKGLLGSEYYVENPVIPLEQTVYCFNSDNGGYNDTSLATIVGLDRTTARENIVSASAKFGLVAIEDPAPEQGLFDRSDNVHFAAKGIPAPTFSMGFTSFDGEATKHYHQPSDHADTIDYDYLLKFFRAYVMSGRSIANDDTTPFWVSGDKYEEAGKTLYSK